MRRMMRTHNRYAVAHAYAYRRDTAGAACKFAPEHSRQGLSL
jgi:hypothetical protein